VGANPHVQAEARNLLSTELRRQQVRTQGGITQIMVPILYKLQNWYQSHASHFTPLNAFCVSTKNNDFWSRYQHADAIFFLSPSLQWTTSRHTRASHIATAHAFTAHAFNRILICRSQPVSSTHQSSGKEDSHISHRWHGIATTQTKMSMTQQNLC
jgi:hypothetical protein